MTAQHPTLEVSWSAIAALHHVCVLGLLAGVVAVGLPIADAQDVPSRAVVATVLSQSIHADQLEPSAEDRQAVGADRDCRSIASLRARRLEALIVMPLRKRFCAEHDCKAMPEEVRAFFGAMTASTVPSGSDPHERRDARRMARDFIEGWKFHKALQESYGGEVIWQVLGPNAVGARRRWLEAEESAGHFRILTTELRTAFYEAIGGYGGNPVSAKEATDAFLPSSLGGRTCWRLDVEPRGQSRRDCLSREDQGAGASTASAAEQARQQKGAAAPATSSSASITGFSAR